MRKLFLLLALGASLRAATVTCIPANAFSETNCTASQGDTVVITLPATSTAASMYGSKSVGSVVLTNSTTATYTAPSTITAPMHANGVQYGAIDSIWNTRIDGLPVLSRDSQYHQIIDPANCAGLNGDVAPCAGYGGSQSTNGSNITQNANAVNFGPSEPLTVFDGTETGTVGLKGYYDGDQGSAPPVTTFPDWRLYPNKTRRENGFMRNYPTQDDYHISISRTSDSKTFESYQDNVYDVRDCHTTTYHGCNVVSYRITDWWNYAASGGVTAGADPRGPMQWTAQEIIDGKIGHATGFTTGQAGVDSNHNIWPSGSYTVPAAGVYPLRPPYGTRFRLSPSRFRWFSAPGTPRTTPIVVGFTGVTGGAGYTPGSTINVAISGCTGTAATAQAFINSTGSIASGRGGDTTYYVYITNTGDTCTGTMTATFDAPPAGGTTATGTPTIITPSTYQAGLVNTYLSNLITGMQNYGMILDDKGTQNQIIVNPDVYTDTNVSNALFYFSSQMGSPLLLEAVDESGIDSSANNLAALGGTSSWQADSNNANVASNNGVPGQAVVNYVHSGTTTPVTIALHGVSVGAIPVLNITDGMSAYVIPSWVTGDKTAAGVTWSIITDPGGSLNTSTGAYTPPATGTTATFGKFKVTSNANSNAYAYVYVNTLPFAGTPTGIRIDTNGSGTTNDGTTAGNAWIASCCSETNWVSYNPTEPAWKFTPSTAMPSALLGIYQTTRFTYGDDALWNFVLPNGNYKIHYLLGSSYTGQPYTASNDPTKIGLMEATAQGQFAYHAHCVDCAINGEYGLPDDLYVPAKVTNNRLNTTLLGYMASLAQSTNRYASNGSNNGWGRPMMGGIEVVQDTTPAHWEIGTWEYGQFTAGDGYKVAPGGKLNLYIRDWYTGLTDPVFTLLSGPGSISTSCDVTYTPSARNGLMTGSSGVPGSCYIAPVDQPAANACAVVKATSASTPTVTATQSICMTGGTKFNIK